ncbi:hypothetical protein ACLESO_04855, partial [Pyxidicoccus sp. 3LG]
MSPAAPGVPRGTRDGTSTQSPPTNAAHEPRGPWCSTWNARQRINAVPAPPPQLISIAPLGVPRGTRNATSTRSPLTTAGESYTVRWAPSLKHREE